MATKLDLFKLFSTGQGISGGISEYVNYPQDHDENYGDIQASVNQIIDEVNAARLADSQIPQDLLLRRDITQNGRFVHDTAKVTRSGQNVTISTGLIFVAGRRIIIVGQTFDFTGLSNGTYFIAVDRTGLLSNSTTGANQEFDVVTVVWTSPTLLDANVTDNLYNEGLTFLGADAGFLQQIHIPPKETPNNAVSDNLFPAREKPTLRYLSNTGTAGDAGFFAGDTDEFIWVGDRGTASVTVLAGMLRNIGQLHLLQQARVFAERTTTQGITTGAGFTGIIFDSPAANAAGLDTWRREPSRYFANPFVTGASASLVIPTDAGGALDGTYLWTAHLVIDIGDATWVDVRIQKTTGGAKTIARQRVAESPATETVINLTGLMDMEDGDTVQLQIDHDGTGTQDVTFARLCGMMIGGPHIDTT